MSSSNRNALIALGILLTLTCMVLLPMFEPLKSILLNHGIFSFPILSAEIHDAPAISLDHISSNMMLELCSEGLNTTQRTGAMAGSSLWRALGFQKDDQLTALQSLSMTNSLARNISMPTLFKSIAIEGDWSTASRALKVVENCPAMLENISSFRFDVFSSSPANRKKLQALSSRLAEAIVPMPKMRKITLALPEHETDIFAKAFASHEVTLPNVETVVVGSFCDFVISHCPGVKSVSSNGSPFLHSTRDRPTPTRSDLSPKVHAAMSNAQQGLGATQERPVFTPMNAMQLITAAAAANNVTSFEMSQYWRAGQIQQVYNYLPHLQSLALLGGQYWDPPERYIPVIAQFEALKELVLTNARFLNVDFDPPWCGNAYEGEGGAELARRVEEEFLQVAQDTAMRVFKSIRSLVSLWIGDNAKAIVERNAEGQPINMTWSFEDRVTPRDLGYMYD